MVSTFKFTEEIHTVADEFQY